MSRVTANPCCRGVRVLRAVQLAIKSHVQCIPRIIEDPDNDSTVLTYSENRNRWLSQMQCMQFRTLEIEFCIRLQMNVFICECSVINDTCKVIGNSAEVCSARIVHSAVLWRTNS